MTQIHFDFSPKGGPAELTGVWAAATSSITWPDGNAWSKFADDATSGARTRPLAAARPPAVLVSVAILAVAAAVAFRGRLRRKLEAVAAQPRGAMPI